jgi:Tfp pilus assembly protein PilE
MVIGLNNSKRKAFSLSELLVIVAIVGVLMSAAISSYSTYVARAKASSGINLLDSYKEIAMGLRARYGTIAPYYVLFSDSNTNGLVSGSSSSSSAVKSVSLKYVSTISADSGTSGSDTYILIGAGLQHDNLITSGADHVYIAGLQDPTTGIITWTCGVSASKGDTVSSLYLPQSCQATLP